MITTTLTPSEKLSYRFSPDPLSETPPIGSDSLTNPSKEAFFLLDLLKIVKDQGTTLGQFKCNHGKGVTDAGIKH